jgi:hypothetical protein
MDRSVRSLMRTVRRRSVEWAVATTITMLAFVSTAEAHHSSSMFVLTSPVWVHGTVVRFDRVNPHSIVTVEEKADDGQTYRWAVEGPDLRGLDRRGIGPDFLKTGDVVRFCAFPLRVARPPSAVADRSAQFVHGHILVMPDGQKSPWGSYGKLGECIRSDGDGERQSWLDFVNSDPRIGNTLCGERTASWPAIEASKAFVKAFVEEVNGLLAQPCE